MEQQGNGYSHKIEEKLGFCLWKETMGQMQSEKINEPFAKVGFLFKIKACKKCYRRHIVDIPRIKFFA
jgi:hypothetical protein